MTETIKWLSARAMLATAALALIFFGLLSPSEVCADPIAITGGFYRLESPFRTIPRYISFSYDMQGADFRIIAGQVDGPSQPLGSNCPAPCTAGSTFSLSGLRLIAPLNILELGGQGRFGFFAGSQSQFTTGNVTIPLDAGSELTLITFFTMTGTINFQEYDLQRLAYTGFTFTSGIFGSGLADISLFFSQTTRQYEVSRVQYNFQPEPVPEPATLVLLGTGLVGFAAEGYKRLRGAKSGMTPTS